MYAKLLAAAPEGGVSRTTPLDEKRQKHHVQRQIPSMVIEIDKGEEKDFIIEVDNPYPQIGVEIVSSNPTTGTVSRLDLDLWLSTINKCGLSFSSWCIQ